MNNKRICIIGAGIHGITSAIALAEAGFDVSVIEKNEDILQGTSGSTHNRAHMGYHYPRSKETAEECIKGLRYFEKKYPGVTIYPKDVYYLIAKNSKTTFEFYRDFCDIMSLPYELDVPSSDFINKNLIENGFKVPEPIFDMFKLKSIFKKNIKEKNINIFTSTELINFHKLKNQYSIECIEKSNNKKYFYTDYILNATYAYSNNILKILKLEKDITKYTLQYTEVAILKSEKYVPSMTIMDGPYVSLMPYANSEKNLYLLYDVVNSVIEKREGYYFKDKIIDSNIKNMLKHCNEYFPFKLEYIKSLYGSRPIPINLNENKGDCRKTRIKCHEKYKGIYSILEGKFISAALIAEDVVTLINKN